jgi:hypothetical protein
LARAIALAPSGGTIVLDAGTYHERVEVPADKRLTIQSAPHAAVWLDGSSAVTGWARSGSTWVKTGWTAKFDSTPSYTSTIPSGPDWSFVNPAYPMAAHPDQMWIGGTGLRQVGSEGEVGAGRFFADYANSRLVIGSDPSSGEVRASDIGYAMTIRSDGSVLRGIGFRRYATAVHDMAAVRITGTNNQLENLVASDNATTGLGVFGHNATVRNVTVQRNGMLGATANVADGLSVTGLLSTDNNVEHFNQAPVAGGFKIGNSHGITIRDSVIRDNLGTALWFDVSCTNAVVVGNSLQNNSGHGLSYEISSTAVIADNLVTGNGGDGFKINDADHVRIWNNTLGANGRNIELVQDSRASGNPAIPWQVASVQVMDNVLDFGPQYMLYVRDYTDERSAATMGITVDGNVFFRSSTSEDAEVVWQGDSGKVLLYRTMAEFAATGAGSHNAESSSSATTAAQTATNAIALPTDIASMIGEAAGTRHVGAF